MKHKLQSLIICLIFLLPSFVLLEADSTSTNNHTSLSTDSQIDLSRPIDEEHFYSDFANMMMTLGMIVGLMLLASWFLKRMTRTRQIQLNTSSTIKILEQRQLSARSSIHLIQVGDKKLLLGESASNLIQLAEFPSSQGTN